MLSCYKTEILTHFGDQFVRASICSWPNFTPVRLMLHRQCPHIGDKQRKCHKKMYGISSVGKNISMNLLSKACVSKTQFWAKISIFSFLLTPALECYLSEIFLLTPALECIFVVKYFCRHYPTMLDWEGGIGEGGGIR